jgi:hypothetical protein
MNMVNVLNELVNIANQFNTLLQQNPNLQVFIEPINVERLDHLQGIAAAAAAQSTK